MPSGSPRIIFERKNVMKMKYSLLTIIVCLLFAAQTGCGDKQDTKQNKEIKTMKKRIINPWKWQDKFGFVQANEVTDAKRTLYTAGIVSVDGNGKLLHKGNMEKQINQIINNLEILVKQADFKLSDVVRFTYYTTDVQAFGNASHILIERLEKANCKPATSLIGVNSLFHPDCVVEIEAIVVD
jgi:enamine deaminase RidA (YjgF/YER057c/UK114 family)